MTDPAAPTTGRTFVSPLPPREVSLNPSSTNGSADADADVDSGAPPRPKPGLWVAAESDSIPAHLAPAAFYVATTAFGLGTLAGCAALLGAPMFSPRTVQGAMQSGWGWGGQPENGGKEVRWLWDRPQFFVFLAAWAVFHMLEFVITAVYNSTRLFADCEFARKIERLENEDGGITPRLMASCAVDWFRASYLLCSVFRPRFSISAPQWLVLPSRACLWSARVHPGGLAATASQNSVRLELPW